MSNINKKLPIIPNDKPLTRSRVLNNPNLKNNISDPFTKSTKLQHSPPKNLTKKNLDHQSGTSSNISEIQEKNIQQKNSSILNSKVTKNSGSSPNTTGNISIIDADYTDIEDFLSQESLIIGKEKFNQSSNNKKELETLINENLTEFTKMEQTLKLPLKDVANLVPEFDGKNITVSEYIEKLKQARNIISSVDEKNLTQILKIKLKGEAYRSLNTTKIDNITELISAIKSLYPIQDNIYILYGKLSQIFQKENENVINFTNRVKDLVLQIKELKRSEPNQTPESIEQFDNELNENAVKSFKDGLKFEIRIELGDHKNLSSASLKAIEIENKLKKQKDVRNSVNVNNLYYQDVETSNTENKILICQICKGFDHEALFCKSAACVYCKDSDHFSNNCQKVTNKIKLICKFCSKFGHSVSACKFNKSPDCHCQYCQEMGHEVHQCPFIREYEVCWKCKESGHNPHVCPNKNHNHSIISCDYCNNSGHTLQNCPEVICQNCNKQGHTVKFCKANESRYKSRMYCTFCEEDGHDSNNCEQVKVLVTQNKFKQSTQCQICNESGHIAKYCPLLKSTNNLNLNTNLPRKNQNMRNFNNGRSQYKRCEYCKTPGHTTNECRKLQAVKNYVPDKPQMTCSYCGKTGHTIDICNELKFKEESIQSLCKKCKNMGHTYENCPRNSNQQQNYQGNE